ncbi:E3 ubiquitin-protein ligase TRIM11-like [Anomaloglossus baeobatrachus]|uniref:E3 ubiquitin-protein ligase TRIM11-like n=1 Tax=Anomaloglossus baeobatrachus TaxID=238106 RepID=UPI003F508FFA
MASAGLEKELECSVCLTLYTDPITMTCGHNFCRECIDRVLDTQDESGVYTCPECREEFQYRPTLKKNITLCNVVETFRSNLVDDSSILCTYCIHSPAPAVRSCLLCEASLCDNHLRVHSKGPEHVLTDPTTSLGNRKCSVHKKILEYYCNEDAACICASCSLAGEHRGHRVEMLDEASEKKKMKLRNVLQKLITKRKKTEEKVQTLEEHWRNAQEKATVEAERVTTQFIDIRRRVDHLEKRLLSEISRWEELVSLSLSDVIQKLEIKKDELSRKMRHIEELCNMTDPLTVLQDPDTGDLCDPEEDGGDETGDHDGGPEQTGGQHGGDEQRGEQNGGVWDAELITNTLSNIIEDGNVTPYVQEPEEILLDVNTAANKLLISDDLKTATWSRKRQSCPRTAERFQYYQVMSRRRFTSGRHYWDVEITDSEVWRLGMCYPSMARRGRQSESGENDKSWCLYRCARCNLHYSVMHKSKSVRLPQRMSSDMFRIYLDYEAGQLSFYELCDPIRHLHTFTAAFTEPLHALLYLCGGSLTILGGNSR